jgi:hypothetical protein
MVVNQKGTDVARDNLVVTKRSCDPVEWKKRSVIYDEK